MDRRCDFSIWMERVLLLKLIRLASRSTASSRTVVQVLALTGAQSLQSKNSPNKNKLSTDQHSNNHPPVNTTNHPPPTTHFSSRPDKPVPTTYTQIRPPNQQDRLATDQLIASPPNHSEKLTLSMQHSQKLQNTSNITSSHWQIPGTTRTQHWQLAKNLDLDTAPNWVLKIAQKIEAACWILYGPMTFIWRGGLRGEDLKGGLEGGLRKGLKGA